MRMRKWALEGTLLLGLSLLITGMAHAQLNPPYGQGPDSQQSTQQYPWWWWQNNQPPTQGHRLVSFGLLAGNDVCTQCEAKFTPAYTFPVQGMYYNLGDEPNEDAIRGAIEKRTLFLFLLPLKSIHVAYGAQMPPASMTYRDISLGLHDESVRRWAKTLVKYRNTGRKDIWYAFAPGANMRTPSWLPWALDTPGFSLMDYHGACQRIWAIFQGEGCTNVYPSFFGMVKDGSPSADYWQVIPWMTKKVGLIGYDNRAPSYTTPPPSFKDMFTTSYQEMKAAAPYLQMYVETGAVAGPWQTAWYHDMGQALDDFEIDGVLLNTSPAYAFLPNSWNEVEWLVDNHGRW